MRPIIFTLSTFMMFALHATASEGSKTLENLVNEFRHQQDQALVETYLSQKHSEKYRLDVSHPCPPPPTNSEACIDKACDLLGSFGCNDSDEIYKVARACRGNYGDRCLTLTCNKLGSFGCDEMSEISQVGNACSGVWDTGCFVATCKRLGVFACDDMSEVTQVHAACGQPHSL